MFWYDVAICLSDSYIHRAVVDFDCRACNLRPLIVSQLAIRCWHWQSRRGYIIVGVASNTIGVCFALMSEIATQESSTFEHHFSFKYIQSSIRAQLLRSEWVLNHTWKTCRCDCVAHCTHLSVLLLTLSLMAPIFFFGALRHVATDYPKAEKKTQGTMNAFLFRLRKTAADSRPALDPISTFSSSRHCTHAPV